MQINWFARDIGGLPEFTPEGDDPSTLPARLRAAGFTAQAAEAERRLETSEADALYEPMGDLEVACRSKFSRIEMPATYSGSVPTEVVEKFTKLREEEIFDDIYLWIARKGEVLAVGTKRVGGELRKYLLVQWHPDNKALTKVAELQKRQRRIMMVTKPLRWNLLYIFAGLAYTTGLVMLLTPQMRALSPVYFSLGISCLMFGMSRNKKKKR